MISPGFCRITDDRSNFWPEVLCVNGSVTPYVKGRVLAAGAWALVVWVTVLFTGVNAGFGVAPYELIGVVLALLLVLRTNSGYDRWYEARKLWGGIVNQSRNLALIATAYGPGDIEWRDKFLRWTAAFPHLVRRGLRQERELDELQELLSADEIEKLKKSDHLSMCASLEIGRLLKEAVDRDEMDQFAFLRAEEQRSTLIDHMGACERILKTPLAKVVSIKIRRFLFLYLTVLPIAIVDRCGALSTVLTMLVAYPLLSLDQIGIELQNPFSPRSLSHLPLEEIGDTIQRNVMLLNQESEATLATEPVRNGYRKNGHAHPHARVVG